MPKTTLFIVGGLLGGAALGLLGGILYCMSKKTAESTVTISKTTHTQHVFQAKSRPAQDFRNYNQNPNPNDMSDLDNLNRNRYPDDDRSFDNRDEYSNRDYEEDDLYSEEESRGYDKDLQDSNFDTRDHRDPQEEFENFREERPRPERRAPGNNGLHPLDVASRNRTNYAGYY